MWIDVGETALRNDVHAHKRTNLAHLRLTDLSSRYRSSSPAINTHVSFGGAEEQKSLKFCNNRKETMPADLLPGLGGPHLSAGSPEPRLRPGRPTLFSMRYCPFAQRAMLVAARKGIE